MALCIDITGFRSSAPTEPMEPQKPEKSILRLAGDNRFETAYLVADQMKKNLGIERFDAVVASGADFADALAGSYPAAVKNAPILLAYNDIINGGVKDCIRASLNPGCTFLQNGQCPGLFAVVTCQDPQGEGEIQPLPWVFQIDRDQ